ncbi:MAG: TrkH family potassium uptake protein [Gammaproteobacteria bacterium]|nr:TrkH family potassium uptake protein [Gammaproteobacteria bacterium]MCW8840216.1 TrkH family potassium uptake protein [Gammaproteobacteria bacterium]MCW8927407.1 TrkH family potassium uptake protein [Gammaproteobacteria bacterium]MCW8959541.1 TrkH family potassium uptake protein [Gammaproteobacteria bacterium]MCW8992297.1 TrkH family potassium uptake protein [Gammaproteobacteria bacterium]
MQLSAIQRILGLLLMLFSTTMLPPALVSLIYRDGFVVSFLLGMALTLLTGLLMWLPARHNRRELRLRDGFVVVVMFWSVLGLFGALPFAIGAEPNLSITDAVFESISGLTTTGATVITGIDQLPHSLLFYRQQLQWLGGMGIIVLAVAILPMLGIGGMQLYRAETPGPMKDNKLTPRITETAKALWYIYLGLTVSCTIAYWLAGMSFFDAISHAFSTVAIGGFSTHDASMGYFREQPLIEVIAIIFMFLSGINFALHFIAWRSKNIQTYLLDSEFRTYLTILAVVTLITVFYLHINATFDTFSRALLHGVFQVVSIGTTTGFTTSNYAVWPGFLPVLLLFASFVGGCAGSTAGGMKVIRFLLLLKQGMREINRLVHPNAVISIKVGGKPLSEKVINSVWGFFATYVAVFSIIMLLLMLAGFDQVTAFSAVAATINNLGPGLGEVALNYSSIPDFTKWVLCFAMLLGRLEIFTLLVLLTPAFWRK